MTKDVRAAYDQAAKNAGAKGVIPVGETWLRAMQSGVADQNPYDGIARGHGRCATDGDARARRRAAMHQHLLME